MARTQAEAIQKGVHKYREEDNAVRVFELILRNEVDVPAKDSTLMVEEDSLYGRRTHMGDSTMLPRLISCTVLLEVQKRGQV